MSGMREPADCRIVTMCRAEDAPVRSIDIAEAIPTFGPNYMSEARAFYLREAERLHGVLLGSLPGGTLDNLFAVMAAERASILRVARPVHTNPPAEPEDGDVVDAEIDYSDAYTELAEMRLAVLAIHKQAEWGACCDWCHYDDRDVPWPCPTAQALGVTA